MITGLVLRIEASFLLSTAEIAWLGPQVTWEPLD